MYCAPSNNKHNKFSCFTTNQILKICKIYNQHNKNKININSDIKTVYKQLKQKFNNIDEHLWLEDSKLKKYIPFQGDTIFVPKMPSEWCKDISIWRNETNNNYISAPWLSNLDIDKVINQYHDKYTNFVFLGTYPIDFQKRNLFGCISHLCGFKINDIISMKKNSFGIVLNTDKHNQSGSHWISIFCNLKKFKIYFFNSANSNKYAIPSEVIEFVKDIQSQVKQIYRKKLEFKFNNKVKHQSSSSECGIYSIYFILSMLDADELNNNGGDIFDKYFNNPEFKISDKKMLDKRFKYFRPNDKCNYK